MTTMRTAVMVHPSAELYGSDRMFAESAHALTEGGWRVVAVLPHEGPLAALLRDHGAEIVCCPTPVLRKAALRPAGLVRLLAEVVRSAVPMLRLLRKVAPDVVYVNTVTIPLWLVLARLWCGRVVAHVHEAEDDVPAVVRVALAAPLLAARVVVFNSNVSANTTVRSIPRLGRKMCLIYNGVAGPGEPPRRRGQRPGEPARLVLVGRLSPRKGSDVAIEAVQRLHQGGRRVRLDLFGSVFPGYEWFEDQLRARIAEAGLQDHVRLHGFAADIWQAYAGADIALVPSTKVESFGNASVEAQLAEVPVIVTDVPGLPETVSYGEYGTVAAAGDPDALAGAVRQLLDDWHRTREIATAAQRHARTRFAPEEYRNQILKIANELCDQ